MKYITYQYTCQGKRPNNEDFSGYQLIDNGGLWALADGLGGHKHSEEASRLTIQYMLEQYRADRTIDFSQAIGEANNLIREMQTRNPEANNAATTIVAALVENDNLRCAHVGDSRFYYFNDCRIVYQTKDHTVAQAAVDLGEITRDQQRVSLDRNRLLKAVGSTDQVRADVLVTPISVQAGDAFLLCSDGFWEWIYETELEIDLSKSSSPRAWADYMLCRVRKRQRETADNFTVLCCMITE
ncbi:MAG: hypothetical protein K0S76_2187 [Herbinix sp.]|jgi:serine/threonine protein phosphatase PrpC|nr:hypothetical protein [Herbinix sp.]